MVSAETGLELPVESFHHSVAGRMIACRSSPVTAEEALQLRPQGRFKLRSAVRRDGGRYSEAGNPVSQESTSHGSCLAVRYGDRFWPSREMVDAGEDVDVAP